MNMGGKQCDELLLVYLMVKLVELVIDVIKDVIVYGEIVVDCFGGLGMIMVVV